MTSPYTRRPRQPLVRKIKIEIPLPSRPADYVPNSGPPLRRLDLRPPEDSTAYIDDRILLPPAGLAADGRLLPKRMKYIIGWHDLPAARLLVPAMDVLDYVSPCALEDWEYNMELELDVERARLEAERQVLKMQTLHQGPASELPKTKRPGRPPLHHTNIETAVVAEAENEDGEHTRHRGGAMSLSTPKKRKMDDFLDGYTSDESPSEQLLFDFARSMDQKEVELAKEDVKSVDELPRGHPAALNDGDHGPRGVKSQYLKKPISNTKMTLPMMSAPVKSKLKPGRSQSPALPFPDGGAPPREPTHKPVTQAKPHSSRPMSDFLSAARSNGGTLQPLKPQIPSKASSELPVDKAEPRQPQAPKQMSALARKYSGMSKTPTHRVLSKVPSLPQLNKTQSQREDGQKPLSALAQKYRGTARPPTSVSCRIPPQPRVDQPQRQPQVKSKQSSALSQKDSDASKPPAQRAVSKVPPDPQLGNARPRSLAKPKYRSHVAQKKESKPQARKPVLPKAKQSPRMPIFVDSSSDSDSGDEDDEQTWDVDRIEDMELFDVEGEGLVRYFKVRWEGDWPPEQNPTWEPEKNLPQDLVAEFCRTFNPRGRSKLSSEPRRASRDEDMLQLPVLKQTSGTGMDNVADRPSSSHSGLFVYSSDDGMDKHIWDAPNSQGHRPNHNGVYPARMV
ncbi:hypothetical protein LLEC1_03823 [Akanthomyces lecanii]|uniref:Chromo domain-containing protein n=1 Tax=Cordyceps confragosa TaxID=2714763 RepID=A0A179IIX5_CORDF|nr:hypothetical protein LLEC1_03823 [Akanthomyces lecanii]